MGNLWLKIKVWTKGLIFGALVAYGLLFLFNNRKPVTFWYWFGHEPETSLLVLIGATFFAGVIGTILVRTTFTTLRQMRELRERGRIDRIERENAAMKAKAAMLQTRTSTPAPSAAPMTNDANQNDQ